jgi:hypothetical protein
MRHPKKGRGRYLDLASNGRLRQHWPMNITWYLALTLAFPFLALAEENVSVSTASQSTISSAVSCEDITDKLCQEIWSEKNRGSKTLFDGSIAVGKSKKSDTSQIVIVDLKALVNSEKLLPKDLQTEGASALRNLRHILSTERLGKQWQRDLSKAMFDWNRAFEKVGTARVESKNPALKKLKGIDITVEQSSAYQKSYNTLRDEILVAKHSKSQGWKMIEELFPVVKKDLQAEIQKLPISDEAKKARLTILDEVQLTLPFTDREKFAASHQCQSTEINAFYSSDYNKFTVCAGLFGALRSRASIYFILAHEMGHAIDLDSFASQSNQSHSVVKKINKLAHSKTPAFSCEDWQRLLEEIRTAGKEVGTPKSDPLQKLADCLAPKKNLREFNQQNVGALSESFATSELSSAASSNNFLELSEPNTKRFDQDKKNPHYLRPDRVTALAEGQFVNATQRDANIFEIVNQQLACIKNADGSSYISHQSLTASERPSILKKVLDDTKVLKTSLNNLQLTDCGTNCRALVGYNVSADSGENFSDWIAGRALSTELQRYKNVEERRQAAALSAVLFCNRPDITTIAPDAALVEKQFSTEPHPNNRLRRLAVFNQVNSQLVDCQISDAARGFGSCLP